MGVLDRLKKENPEEYSRVLAEMLERGAKRYILQVDGENYLGKDSDGNPLFEIPPEGLTAWIQDEDGRPTAGNRYIRLTVRRDGTVDVNLQG